MSLKIQVHGETQNLPETTPLEGWVQSLEIPYRHVAIAINGEVIPRSQWTLTSLTEGDEVQIIHAVGGG